MKRKKRNMLAVLVTAVFLCFFSKNVCAELEIYQEMKQDLYEKNNRSIHAETLLGEGLDGPGTLYAQSAVLMDGDSGRILYEKEGEVPRANASTTKVLTCILAIERAPGDDYVLVSKRAASQPEVKLGMSEGEQYYLEDLLYSLMLKSHNDTAVAIAEHIGGSVEGFAKIMNKKAKEIGCKDTYFITPNGLDEEDEGGEHHTTAADLALLMRYAIKNQVFLHITQTRDYSFGEITGKKHFSLNNTNALFNLTDGVISGKTGFTGKAGYCYVCACEKDGKCFIIALLGCGWPNNKTYKWKDTIRLLRYGEDTFDLFVLQKELPLSKIPVTKGTTEDYKWGQTVCVNVAVQIPEGEETETILIRKGEKVSCRVKLPNILSAPIKKDQEVGEVSWYIGRQKWKSHPVRTVRKVDKISFRWCFGKLLQEYIP